MNTDTTPTIAPAHKKLSISLDFRLLSVILLIIILVMVGLWRPWEPRYGTNARTIDVTGKATVSAVPDEYVFSPTYDFTNVDQATALAALTAKSGEIVGKLKALGVPSSDIKTNADSYNNYPIPLYAVRGGNGSTYTLRLTVTVTNSKLVQQVQDYLVSTSPSGEVTPQADFSQAKQNELESQARDTATKDARSKAEQSAQNLGFQLGPVKSVQDDTGFGDGSSLFSGSNFDAVAPSQTQSLPVQPGRNELSYSVSVTYFLR